LRKAPATCACSEAVFEIKKPHQNKFSDARESLLMASTYEEFYRKTRYPPKSTFRDMHAIPLHWARTILLQNYIKNGPVVLFLDRKNHPIF
jgi:hypothetical protein